MSQNASSEGFFSNTHKGTFIEEQAQELNINSAFSTQYPP